jgi:hypothetical protein
VASDEGEARQDVHGNILSGYWEGGARSDPDGIPPVQDPTECTARGRMFVKRKRMRSGLRGVGLAALAAVVAYGGFGCAQSRPCMIIPAQIELAKSRRDKAKEAYDQRLEEVTRALTNLEASRSRLERLAEERQELQELLGNGGDQ